MTASDHQSEWEYVVCLGNVMREVMPIIDKEFPDRVVFDPLESIRDADEPRRSRLVQRWGSYDGVRVILPVISEKASEKILTFIRSRAIFYQQAELVIGFKARTVSEIHYAPTYVSNIISDLKAVVAVNYTAYD